MHGMLVGTFSGWTMCFAGLCVLPASIIFSRWRNEPSFGYVIRFVLNISSECGICLFVTVSALFGRWENGPPKV